jgi:polyhydroxybutyrate depolymerase
MIHRWLQFGCSLLAVAGLAGCRERVMRAAENYPHDGAYSIQHGGRTRTYEIHLPPNYTGRERLPLVLNLHGGGGNATAHRLQTQMDPVADKFGFIVVYPEGTSGLGRMYTWNAGLCCGYALNNHVDDVGFINALLDELQAKVAVDPTRVYATGMSNGAMMCYRLACELAPRITAICGVASTMGVDGPRPTRPVPIMQIHGLQDPNAPFNGGVGPNAILKVQHKSVRDVIRWWCEVDHCDPRPAQTQEAADYIMEKYLPRAGEHGAPIELYALREGGHTWPGGVDVTPRLGTGKLITTFNADVTMWEFFRQFQLEPTATVAPPGPSR